MRHCLAVLPVVALLALAACAPRTSSISQDFVIISYDGAIYKRDKQIQAQADKECGTFGRKARFVSSDHGPPLGILHDRFACEAPKT